MSTMDRIKQLAIDAGVQLLFEDESTTFRSLKKFYKKKVHVDLINMMKKMKICFIEVLTVILTEDKIGQLFLALKEELCSTFGNKTEFSVKELLEAINMDSTFISSLFLTSYFRKSQTEFRVTNLAHGILVKPVGFTKEHYTFLMKNRPSVMRSVLSESTDWDHLVLAYDIWKKDCMGVSTCLQWIYTMAKFEHVENFRAYRDQVRVQLALKIMTVLFDKELEISQITNILCENYYGFLSNAQVFEILQSERCYFVIKEIGSEISNWLVSINPEKAKQVMNKNNPTPSSSIKEVATAGEPFCIKLNEDQERRISPLLTLKVKFDNVVNIYKSLKKKKYDDLIAQILNRYGCFCEFLISFCKFQKPKLNFTVYRERLENLLVQEIHQCLNDASGVMQIQQVLDKLENYGTINKNFLMNVMYNQTELFRVYEETVALITIDISEQQKRCLVGENQLNDSGIFRVINLTVKFNELQHLFKFMKRYILNDLEKSSMCFIEYLISTARRYRSGLADKYAKHVYMLLNEELYHLLRKFRSGPVLLEDVCFKLNSKTNSSFISPSFIIFALHHSETDIKISKDGKYIERDRRYAAKIKKEPLADEIKHVIPYSKFSIKFQEHLSSLPTFQSIVTFISLNERYFSRYVSSSYQTWLNFLLNVTTETKALKNLQEVIKCELLRYIERVLEVNELINMVFSKIPMFTNEKEIVKFLENYPKIFILHKSEHDEYVVGVGKDLNADEKLDFHSELEKRVLYSVLQNTSDTPTTDMGNLWKKLLSEPQDIQDYLFGKRIRSSISTTKFEAYLSTYQCLFYVHRDNKLSLTVPGLIVKKDALKTINMQEHIVQNNITECSPLLAESYSVPETSTVVKAEKRPSVDFPETMNKRLKTNGSQPTFKTEVTDVKPIVHYDSDIIQEFNSLTQTSIARSAFNVLKTHEHLKIQELAKEMVQTLLKDSIVERVLNSTELLKEFIKKIIGNLPDYGFDIQYQDKDSETVVGVRLRTGYRKDKDFFDFFLCKTLYCSNFTAKHMIDMAFDYFLELNSPHTKRKDSFIGYTYQFLLEHSKLFKLTNRYGHDGLTFLSLVDNESEIKKNECNSLLPLTFHLAFSKLKNAGEGIEVPELVQLVLDNDEFFRKFMNFEPQDVNVEAHALICAAMYRRPFYFPNNTNIVCIKPAEQPPFRLHTTINTLKSNPKKLTALLALATLVKQYNCTFAQLSDLWIKRGPPHLINIFGSGLGFVLSLREYDGLFHEDPESKRILVNSQFFDELVKISP